MIEQAAALYQQKNYEQSTILCQQILKKNKRDINALHLLGVICYETGKFDEAVIQLSKAHELASDNQAILLALASSTKNAGDLPRALALFQQSLQSNPEQTSTLVECAKLSLSLNQLTTAEIHLKKLLTLSPEQAEHWNLYGLVQQQLQKPGDAITAFQQAIKLKHSLYPAHLNLASLQQDLGELESAKQHYQIVLNNDDVWRIPKHLIARTHYNLGLIELGSLNLMSGWQHLFCRPKISAAPLPPLNDLKKHRLLVVTEEGLGDELMFLRFLPTLSRFTRSVAYVCQQKLEQVLQQCSEIPAIVTTANKEPEHDFKINLLDLPYWLKINEVHQIPPPLTLDVASLQSKFPALDNLPKPLIGISWRAGMTAIDTSTEKSLHKAVPLSIFTDIFNDFQGTLIILQRDPVPDELQYINENFECHVHHAENYNHELLEMTALLFQLDGYIGVSNTNMHLYGGLGKPACVLIPWPGEWRWADEVHISPWYPDFTLARQSKDKDWRQAIRRCQAYWQNIPLSN